MGGRSYYSHKLARDAMERGHRSKRYHPGGEKVSLMIYNVDG